MKKAAFCILGSFLLIFSGCNSTGVSAETEGTFSVLGSAGDSEAAGLGVMKFLGSPNEVNVQVYAFWLSPNEDCSDPVLIEDNGDTPVEFDLVGHPTLFTGSPAEKSGICAGDVLIALDGESVEIISHDALSPFLRLGVLSLASAAPPPNSNRQAKTLAVMDAIQSSRPCASIIWVRC